MAAQALRAAGFDAYSMERRAVALGTRRADRSRPTAAASPTTDAAPARGLCAFSRRVRNGYAHEISDEQEGHDGGFD